MSEEQLQELREKSELWDSLSDSLRTIFLGKFERPIPNLDGEITENGKGAEQFNTLNGTIIKNTSNANTFIDVLKEANKEIAKGYVGLLEEESKEMVGNTSAKVCKCFTFGHNKICQECLDKSRIESINNAKM